MRILLDDALPEEFRFSFPLHDVRTAAWSGLRGMTDEALISGAEEKGFAALLLVDTGIPNWRVAPGRRVAVISIKGKSDRLSDLLPLAGKINVALTNIFPGQTITME